MALLFDGSIVRMAVGPPSVGRPGRTRFVLSHWSFVKSANDKGPVALQPSSKSTIEPSNHQAQLAIKQDNNRTVEPSRAAIQSLTCKKILANNTFNVKKLLTLCYHFLTLTVNTERRKRYAIFSRQNLGNFLLCCAIDHREPGDS